LTGQLWFLNLRITRVGERKIRWSQKIGILLLLLLCMKRGKTASATVQLKTDRER
jgi:hypothetical protein